MHWTANAIATNKMKEKQLEGHLKDKGGASSSGLNTAQRPDVRPPCDIPVLAESEGDLTLQANKVVVE